MAAINLRDIDDDLRAGFKAWCAKHNSDMTAELRKYMRKVVDKAEKRRAAKK
ncbi:hypothetical protein ES705_06770 [subsurface metagenome]